MKTVIYRSCVKLDCQCNASVILCLDPALTSYNLPFLTGTITRVTVSATSCYSTMYNYYVEYDENTLLDPTYSLINSDVQSISCFNACLIDYLLWNVDGGAGADAVFVHSSGDTWTYIWPAGPPPFGAGNPLAVDIVNVDPVLKIVTLAWHDVVVVP